MRIIIIYHNKVQRKVMIPKQQINGGGYGGVYGGGYGGGRGQQIMSPQQIIPKRPQQISNLQMMPQIGAEKRWVVL